MGVKSHNENNSSLSIYDINKTYPLKSCKEIKHLANVDNFIHLKLIYEPFVKLKMHGWPEIIDNLEY